MLRHGCGRFVHSRSGLGASALSDAAYRDRAHLRWSALLTLTGTYKQLYTWVTFASVAFGVLGGLAIFRLRRSKPDAHRPYRTWGYPVVPALFVIALIALVVNTFIELPVESLVGLTIIALGLPAYRYWSGSARRASAGAAS